ncbi:elongation factor P [Chlamydiales bacterium]|nr:elongation factor P [Chlamydiales bacterium]
MVLSDQITPGMTLQIGTKLYHVETCVKVSVKKGAPFVKTKLSDINTNQSIEKNFKLNQSVDEITLKERWLEFLYLEGKNYLFLDVATLDQVEVPSQIVGDKVHYLKEGIEVNGFFYGEKVSSIELPQFLELMVANIDEQKGKAYATTMRKSTLETGAKVEVPAFIDVGDIVKIDTKTNEYIQRV